MIQFKRIRIKEEKRILKHSEFEWDYYLDYVGRYKDGTLIGISKQEKKYFESSNGMRGGLYINNINKFSNTFQKAKEILENVDFVEAK